MSIPEPREEILEDAVKRFENLAESYHEICSGDYGLFIHSASVFDIALEATPLAKWWEATHILEEIAKLGLNDRATAAIAGLFITAYAQVYNNHTHTKHQFPFVVSTECLEGSEPIHFLGAYLKGIPRRKTHFFGVEGLDDKANIYVMGDVGDFFAYRSAGIVGKVQGNAGRFFGARSNISDFRVNYNRLDVDYRIGDGAFQESETIRSEIRASVGNYFGQRSFGGVHELFGNVGDSFAYKAEHSIFKLRNLDYVPPGFADEAEGCRFRTPDRETRRDIKRALPLIKRLRSKNTVELVWVRQDEVTEDGRK